MKMRNAFAFAFLLLIMFLHDNQSTSCSEGCLACELDSTSKPYCKICDLHNFYRLSISGRCFKQKIENCEVPSSEPNVRICNLCNPGYFLDNRGNRCSPVPEKFKTPNCRRYRWEYSCTECDEGFYRSFKKCKPIVKVVENCQTYLDAMTCDQCKNGYFNQVGSNKCEPLTKKDKCLVYSSVKCTECKAGHFQVNSLGSGALLSSEFIQSLAKYAVKNSLNFSYFQTKPVNQCLLGNIENCDIQSTFDQCSKCKSGFFLSIDKKCQTNPVRVVANCQAYGTANTCTRCIPGFYLQSNVCRAFSEINGCLEFDLKTKNCLKCENSKFYLDLGNCVSRDKSLNISYCSEVEMTSDQCKMCVPSFQLTADKLKCLPHITHCQNYVTSSNVNSNDYTNVNTVALRCSGCDEHFYLSPNKMDCLPQNVEGCLTFTSNTNLCTACASGYFITNTTCMPYTKDFCKTYNETLDKCDSCFEGFFLDGNSCTKYTARNCLTFKSLTDNCATCLKQYYPKTDAITNQINCQPITARNCKEFTMSGTPLVLSDSCASCYQGYIKGEKDCIPISLLNCKVPTQNDNSCSICKSGYYKSNKNCKAYSVKNCAVYSETSNACTSCLFNTNLSKTHKAKVYYLKNENCLEYTVQNCETKVEDDNKCLTCTDNTNWYIGAQGECIPSHLKNCTTLVTNRNNDQCGTCAVGYKLSNGQCFKLNIPGCIEYTGINCITCATGFYKDSNKCERYSISNCATFNPNSNACATCLPEFKLDTPNCIPKTIHLCKKYSSDFTKCEECLEEYYPNGDKTQCDAQSISGCLKYNPTVRECVECRPGYTLNVSKTCDVNTFLRGCMRLDPSNSAKCAVCYRGYERLSDLTCIIVPAIPNCIQYQQNGKKCEICSIGEKPASDGTKCDPITNPNFDDCLILDPMTGNCKECNYGFYLASTNICLAQDITECQVYKPNENKCLQCKIEYFLSSGNCKGYPTIMNCLHYTADRSACLICDNNYYPEGSMCFENSLDKCFSKVRNQNKCHSCKAGFSLGINEDCGGDLKSPTDQNCYYYSKIKKICEMCDKGYYLDGSWVCQTQTTLESTDFDRDPSCLATNKDDSSCGVCPQGNVSFPLVIFKIDPVDPALYTGCAKLNAMTGNCSQCKKNFNEPNKLTKTCTSYTNTGSQKCSQLIEDAPDGTNLDTNMNCFECFNKQTDYNNNKECIEKLEYNVTELDQSTGKPKVCADEAIFTNLSTSVNIFECGEINTKTKSEVNTVSNCEVWDKENDNCKSCEYGFELNNTNITCSDSPKVPPVGVYIKKESDYLQVTEWYDTSAMPTADLVLQIDDSPEFIPALCKTGNHRVIKLDETKTMNYPPEIIPSSGTDSERFKKVQFARSYPQFTCKSLGNNFYSNTTSYPPIQNTLNNCSYWIDDETANVCRGCVGPLFPDFQKMTHNLTAVVINNTVPPTNAMLLYSVVECKTLSEGNTQYNNLYNLDKLEKSYEGLGYHTTGVLPYSTWLSFDSCSGMDYSLIVFPHVDGTSLYPQKHSINIGTTIGEHPFIYCYLNTDKGPNKLFNTTTNHTDIYSLQGGVANCQINYWIPQTEDTNDGQTIVKQIEVSDTAGSRLGCLACKPGHANPVGTPLSSNSTIESCVQISNCNISSDNTWMNACQTCNSNRSWVVTNDWIVQFHVCNDVDNIKCLIADINDTCKVCKEDYLINGSGKCINAIANCTTLGLPKLILKEQTNDTNVNYLIFNFLVNVMLGGIKPMYCETCAGNSFKIVRTNPANTETCTYNFEFILEKKK